MTAENHSITDLLSELEAAAGEVAIANTRAVAGVFPQLRAAARSAGVTHDDLAAALGVDSGEIARILNGEVDITLTDLELILAALDARVRIDVTTTKVSADLGGEGKPSWRTPRRSNHGASWQEAPTATRWAFV